MAGSLIEAYWRLLINDVCIDFTSGFLGSKMSNRTYNQLWVKTQTDIQSVLSHENQALLGRAEKDRDVAFKIVSKLYLQYVKIFRTLDSCYDQMVHPQKRILLRKLLDSTIGRILELKHDLVSLDNLEYSYHDETMAELGLTPSETELIVPKFVISDRAERIKYWQEQMELAKAKLDEVDGDAGGPSMTIEEAVALLQRHERARQGRLRAKLMMEIRRQETAEKMKGKTMQNVSEAMAANKIQCLWKGAIARRKVKKQREDELAFIGMIPPAEYPKTYQNKLGEMEIQRRKVQAEHEMEYEKALVEVKDELREREGDEIIENMKEEIRNWFQTDKEETGKFPDYPSDEEGGSGAVFHPELQPDYVENGAAANQSEKEEASSKKEKKGATNSSKDDKSSGDKKGGKEVGDDYDEGYKLTVSEFVKGLKAADKIFSDTWKNKDESKNKEQRYDEAMIRDVKRSEVEEEIRKQVDSLMCEELDLLKIAVERDKGKKGKISKKRKRSKKKASKKGKKKKDKDLTPDRTTESLFEELVLNGIIKTYPKVRLNEFLGDISYTGSALKSKVGGKEPNPGGGDVRRAIQEYCILPMSSSYLRENSPHIKSCLLVGPEGSGKTMLINAICTELEATLFDLTATNIVGRYPGKSGLNMLLHLVIKVSRLLQPAVVFIDQCEKTFLKKVSKTDKSDPKRLKKDLPRLVRSLASEDCVMLIGTSRCPWECEQKGLTLTYQKMLVLPVPDYSFRYCLWKELIFAKGGQITKYSDRFDTSSLTKVSEGYTAGHIAAAVNATLTERRILQQKMRPLQPVEFIAFLAKCEPIYREEEEAFVQWYAKTPTGKKRFKFLEGDDEEGKKEKKSGKKKKK